MVVRAKIVPGGLYGCEMAPVHEGALETLRGAIADLITFTTETRSADLTFTIASEGTDLDPDIEIWVWRVKSLRRYLAKNSEASNMCNDIYEMYRQRGEPATDHSNEAMEMTVVSGQPGSPPRSRERNKCKPVGPI